MLSSHRKRDVTAAKNPSRRFRRPMSRFINFSMRHSCTAPWNAWNLIRLYFGKLSGQNDELSKRGKLMAPFANTRCPIIGVPLTCGPHLSHGFRLLPFALEWQVTEFVTQNQSLIDNQ